MCLSPNTCHSFILYTFRKENAIKLHENYYNNLYIFIDISSLIISGRRIAVFLTLFCNFAEIHLPVVGSYQS